MFNVVALIFGVFHWIWCGSLYADYGQVVIVGNRLKESPGSTLELVIKLQSESAWFLEATESFGESGGLFLQRLQLIVQGKEGAVLATWNPRFNSGKAIPRLISGGENISFSVNLDAFGKSLKKLGFSGRVPCRLRIPVLKLNQKQNKFIVNGSLETDGFEVLVRDENVSAVQQTNTGIGRLLGGGGEKARSKVRGSQEFLPD